MTNCAWATWDSNPWSVSVSILIQAGNGGNGVSLTIQKHSNFRSATCACCCLGGPRTSCRDLAVAIETRVGLFSTINKGRVKSAYLLSQSSGSIKWHTPQGELLRVKCPKRRIQLKHWLLSYVYGSSSRLAHDSLGSRQQLLRKASPRCSWWQMASYLLACQMLLSSVWFPPFPPFPLLHFFSFTFYFTQISFFASLLPRLLHQAGCLTSLSSASVCSPADPAFSLVPTHLRARHRPCFLLYRSNSPSVK